MPESALEDTKEVEEVVYRAEPTLGAFHSDDSFVRGVRGPVGSGKSSAMCMEIILRAGQSPSSGDGIRRSRWAIIRNSYPELRSTTIPTWNDWMIPRFQKLTFGSPITSICRWPVGDGTHVCLEVWFFSLDKERDLRKLKSMEVTGVWINEAVELDKVFFDKATERVGRYPKKKLLQGQVCWSGVIMDTNPPSQDHWWYELAEEKTPKDFKFWSQPPALRMVGTPPTEVYVNNDLAENVQNHNLGYKYYHRMVQGKTVEWINVFVLGQYGTVKSGKPVFPEYADWRHCPKEGVEPYRTLPMRLAWDFGMTPCVLLWQLSPRGQVRVVDELTSNDMGLRQFIRNVVKPHMAGEYEWVSSWYSTGDPAGTARAQTDEKTCMQVLSSEGIPTEAAPTNVWEARRDVVSRALIETADEGQPRLVISSKAQVLRRGFLGGYTYERIASISGMQYKDKPEKDIHSHIADALQYALLTLDVPKVDRRRNALPVRRRSAKGWT